MSFSKSAILVSIIAALAILSACSPAAATQAPAQVATLRIAVLPIIDTLPMYVAEKDGLFAKHNVKVEFVPVASAPERDQLLAAGQADGTINETLAVMFFNKESAQLQVVRYALRPSEGHGHFFILASGKSGITSPADLKGVEIGVSQGTVIEYVTDRLLQAEGLTSDEIRTVAVPKIPDRMALLSSGELKAGVLPDPQASLAVGQGAKVVIDDSKHPEYGFSVISFRKSVIDANPEAIRSFLAAIEEATALLNQDATEYYPILSERQLIPKTMIRYMIPPFPTAGVPTPAEWEDALSWAKQKGMLSADVSYAESVNSSLLP